MKGEFSNASESFKRLNPQLFGALGAVEKPVAKPNAARALDRGGEALQASPCRMVISLVRHSRRSLDSDNLAGGFKPLRDAIAASLGVDDADPRIEWNYDQLKTTGKPGTIVLIEKR